MGASNCTTVPGATIIKGLSSESESSVPKVYGRHRNGRLAIARKLLQSHESNIISMKNYSYLIDYSNRLYLLVIITAHLLGKCSCNFAKSYDFRWDLHMCDSHHELRLQECGRFF